MKFSRFGRKIGQASGISQLMDDLGAAMAGQEGMRMLGGGNPAHIPEVQAAFRASLERLLARPGAFERVIGNYDAPRGHMPFIEALAALLRDEFGWAVGPRNIVLTNGSQSAFFSLFNMLAGEGDDGRRRRILLPLAPEYIGYTDTGVIEDLFMTRRPGIEFLDDHLFKYHVDFDRLEVTPDVAAICASRPTNPTGNVLTDGEVERLRAIARRHGIPLILDNAYGAPFPQILFTEVRPVWDENLIVCMSLSKLGLPGSRTGIVVAGEEVAVALSRMNAVMNLAPGSFGAAIGAELIRSGEILRLSRDVIRPYYEAKARRALDLLRRELEGIPFHIHKPEGAIFLWLWLPGLPITSAELYERLKARGVLVVPGHYFFPGLSDAWAHRDECLRVTYSQDEDTVGEGLRIIADEVRIVCQHAGAPA